MATTNKKIIDLDGLTHYNGKVSSKIEEIETNIGTETTARSAADINLQSQISALSSGSPLVASSVAGMTDTTRVYVNTTDGNWYYYDGDSWEIGGVYQATGIQDESIEGVKIKDDTISPFSIIDIPKQPTKTVFKFAKWIHGYRYFNGNLIEASGYVSSLPVPCYQTAGLTYTPTVSLTSPERVVTFDSMGTLVAEGAITTDGWTPGTVPYTMAITLTEANFASEGTDIVSVSSGNDKISIPWLDAGGENISSRILVYGDSLWANCNGNYNYPSAPYNQSTGPCYGYKQYLESVGFVVDNQAISGTGIIDCWNRTVGKFPQVITSAELENYDTIIISFGRNDSRLSVPLGTLKPVSQHASLDATTFYGAYQSVIHTLLTKNPKLRIILWTMTQSNAGGYGTESANTQGLKEIDYVNAVKNIANLYSANVIDMYNECGINELNLQQYTFEGVHLTNDGYTFTSQYYLNAMRNCA